MNASVFAAANAIAPFVLSNVTTPLLIVESLPPFVKVTVAGVDRPSPTTIVAPAFPVFA